MHTRRCTQDYVHSTLRMTRHTGRTGLCMQDSVHSTLRTGLCTQDSALCAQDCSQYSAIKTAHRTWHTTSPGAGLYAHCAQDFARRIRAQHFEHRTLRTELCTQYFALCTQDYASLRNQCTALCTLLGIQHCLHRTLHTGFCVHHFARRTLHAGFCAPHFALRFCHFSAIIS